MPIQFDYDKLSDENQDIVTDNIRKANRDKSDKFYPEPIKKESFYTKYEKRILDIILSSIAIIVSFPVNLLIAVITYFDVGAPILFKQKRIGKDGKLFTMVKFRNMTNEKDENGVLLRADKRVTKWGKFVRKTSLDELLNFFNVFLGDMSIIGPRPLPVDYRGRFNKFHEIRHSVKPGLDCPLRDPSKVKNWENRLENDAWYAQNVSFRTDLALAWLLVRETLFSKDRNARGEGVNEGTFVGYFEDGRVMSSRCIPEKFHLDQIRKG